MTEHNPFKPAEPTKLYLKLGIYGATGTGKTNLALSACDLGKVCVIDAEGGTTAWRGIYKFDVINTTSYWDAQKALDYIESGESDYDTVVYDPATILYESIIEARVRFVGKIKGEGDAGQIRVADWGHIKRIYKWLMKRFVNLPMNVIVTFREKEKISYKDPDNPQYLGLTFDGEKASDYWFDVWGRMIIHPDGRRIMEVKRGRGIWKKLTGEKIVIPETGGFKKLLEFANWDKIQKQQEKAIEVVKYEDVTDKDSESFEKPRAENGKETDRPDTTFLEDKETPKRKSTKNVLRPAKKTVTRDEARQKLRDNFSKDGKLDTIQVALMWETYQRGNDLAKELKLSDANDGVYCKFVDWSVETYVTKSKESE